MTILINNAGIVNGKTILETNEAMMKKVIEVNTLSHLYTIKEFLPAMIANNKGHIVTIASIAGISASSGMSDYCASKFGAVAIDESLRMEMRKLKFNVKTTCVCPFFINTGMFDGAKARWPLYILDQHYTVKRIINAIRQEEPVLYLPWRTNLIPLLRLLPVPMYDLVCRITGSLEMMDDFKGRH